MCCHLIVWQASSRYQTEHIIIIDASCSGLWRGLESDRVKARCWLTPGRMNKHYCYIWIANRACVEERCLRRNLTCLTSAPVCCVVRVPNWTREPDRIKQCSPNAYCLYFVLWRARVGVLGRLVFLVFQSNNNTQTARLRGKSASLHVPSNISVTFAFRSVLCDLCSP
jgi:hypothetical protein